MSSLQVHSERSARENIIRLAKAEAWDEGMDWANALQSGTDKSDNPYREEAA